jgi:hypothetical protein
VHQACAVLLDEIVCLWRVACLNPRHGAGDTVVYKDALIGWQRHAFERLRKYLNVNTDKLNLLGRLDADHFHAFQPAIDACDVTWSSFDFESATHFKAQCLASLPSAAAQPVCSFEDEYFKNFCCFTCF